MYVPVPCRNEIMSECGTMHTLTLQLAVPLSVVGDPLVAVGQVSTITLSKQGGRVPVELGCLVQPVWGSQRCQEAQRL